MVSSTLARAEDCGAGPEPSQWAQALFWRRAGSHVLRRTAEYLMSHVRGSRPGSARPRRRLLFYRDVTSASVSSIPSVSHRLFVSIRGTFFNQGHSTFE
ncbi:hypothetical protein J6590_007078 [Homalodisca vitripennis]|nr:hypothetical protein J6590_007078 [Homalodisca vitripennis]